MQLLEFTGIVRINKGALSPEITLPGKGELLVAPDDWPTRLFPGTVSICVSDNGFPTNFEKIGTGDGLKRLDKGDFKAALVIPQRKIIGNPIKSDADNPTRGFALVWHADLQVIGTGQEAKCWMFRIIGSDNPTQFDVVSHENLRTVLNLQDGTEVKVTVWKAESNWKPPSPEEIIADWCDAARSVEGGFGIEKAMGYLIGEKFLNFLEGAETDRDWRQAIPTFVSEIKGIFEPWQLAEFLEYASSPWSRWAMFRR